MCDGSKLTKDFLESVGIPSARPSPLLEKGTKPAAQSRLEEQQVDLMKLVQSLQVPESSVQEPAEARPS